MQDMGAVKVLDSEDFLKLMEDQLTQAALNEVSVNVMMTKDYKETRAKLDSTDQLAERNLHQMHAIIYLALDFLTYVEYGKKLEPDTYYYERSIFNKIEKASQQTDRLQRSREAAKIISDNFEEHKLPQDAVIKLGGQMIYYK